MISSHSPHQRDFLKQPSHASEFEDDLSEYHGHQQVNQLMNNCYIADQEEYEEELSESCREADTNRKSITNCSSGGSGQQGRWTKEEHLMFLDGLSRFGKNWKKVEEFVGSRTGAQIRSHAQKFFNKLERDIQRKQQQQQQLFSRRGHLHPRTLSDENNENIPLSSNKVHMKFTQPSSPYVSLLNSQSILTERRINNNNLSSQTTQLNNGKTKPQTSLNFTDLALRQRSDSMLTVSTTSVQTQQPEDDYIHGQIYHHRSSNEAFISSSSLSRDSMILKQGKQNDGSIGSGIPLDTSSKCEQSKQEHRTSPANHESFFDFIMYNYGLAPKMFNSMAISSSSARQSSTVDLLAAKRRRSFMLFETENNQESQRLDALRKKHCPNINQQHEGGVNLSSLELPSCLQSEKCGDNESIYDGGVIQRQKKLLEVYQKLQHLIALRSANWRENNSQPVV